MAVSSLWMKRRQEQKKIISREVAPASASNINTQPTVTRVSEPLVSKPVKLDLGNQDYRIVLNKDTSIKGKLSFEGAVRVDGQVDGELYATESLLIGQSAQVKADITANNLIILGSVEGKITARRSLQIAEGAEIKGKIFAPNLVLEAGARLNGTCKIS